MKDLVRRGKGKNLERFIKEEINPLLRGWMIYFSASEIKGFTIKLDKWLRRKLRNIIWKQLKRNWTRMKALMKRGLSEIRSAQSAFNERGAWWNSGASHMNEAYPKSYFEFIGLLNLQKIHLKYISI